MLHNLIAPQIFLLAMLFLKCFDIEGLEFLRKVLMRLKLVCQAPVQLLNECLILKDPNVFLCLYFLLFGYFFSFWFLKMTFTLMEH